MISLGCSKRVDAIVLTRKYGSIFCAKILRSLWHFLLKNFLERGVANKGGKEYNIYNCIFSKTVRVRGSNKMYKECFKRVIDIILSLVLLLVFAIPLFIVAIAIKLDSKGPIVFKQQRLGLGGKVFTIYKFRSMCVGAEKTGSGVYSGKNDTRVTRVGKFIRATSLDELPQVFNILKGDMSFIGPRPPLTYHPWTIDKYTEQQKTMFNVRPGITGWAQVNGRKEVEWNKRIELNVWYVEHVTLWLDIKILFMTVFKVVTNANNENICETVIKDENQTSVVGR